MFFDQYKILESNSKINNLYNGDDGFSVISLPDNRAGVLILEFSRYELLKHYIKN